MTEPTRIALPGILGEIARIAGTETAVAIAKEFGGQRIYLPRDPRVEHPLVKLVGAKLARLICARIGGRRHDIPSAKPALRWYEVQRLRGEGLSHNQIAKEVGLSRQHVITMLEGIDFDVQTVYRGVVTYRDRCPICGKRRHGARAESPDERQLPLPLGGIS